MNKSDEILLRLQLLLSDQIQNLQKYKSFPNADVYKDALGNDLYFCKF